MNGSDASDVTDASDSSFTSAVSSASMLGDVRKKGAKKRGALRMRARVRDDVARGEEEVGGGKVAVGSRKNEDRK